MRGKNISVFLNIFFIFFLLFVLGLISLVFPFSESTDSSVGQDKMGCECCLLHIASKCPVVSPGVIEVLQNRVTQNPGLEFRLSHFQLPAGPASV